MTAHHPIPLSEQYRAAARDWARTDGHARKLEELKSSELAKRMKALGDMTVAAAEREVKATQEWRDFIEEMAQARTAANAAFAELEYLRMKHNEWRIGQQMLLGYPDIPFGDPT